MTSISYALSILHLPVQDRMAIQCIVSMTFRLFDATEADARAIATLFALSWESPFTRLQFGNMSRNHLAASVTPRIKEQLRTTATKYVVIRDPVSQGIVSCAQWTVPSSEERESILAEDEMEIDEEDRHQMEDEVFFQSLPQNSNKQLIMDFATRIRILRKETVADKKCYCKTLHQTTHCKI